MEPDDFNYLMRHGELPDKTVDSSSNESVDSDDVRNDVYYSYQDYENAKTEKIWSDSETKVPFWIATTCILILASIDLFDGTGFDIEFIFAAAVLWVIVFVGTLVVYTFLKWLSKIFNQ